MENKPNNKNSIQIDLWNKQKLVASEHFRPVLGSILDSFAGVYDRNFDGDVPEPFIGFIVGEAQKSLDDLSTADNKPRVSKLATMLFDLVPGKDMLSVSVDSDSNVNITSKENRVVSGSLKDVAIQDRISTNQLPRIWLVYNKGVLNWLLNEASDENFNRFTGEVLDGSINPHFISKEEVVRVQNRLKDRSVMPAIGTFIGLIKAGESYDESNKIVYERFKESEIIEYYVSANRPDLNKTTPNYRMSNLNK